MEKKYSVGIADMKILRGEGILITYALGSCIGISLYDPVIKLGALVHIMLPKRQSSLESNIYKFADTGLEDALRKMTAYGAVKSRLACKIAGGATMFKTSGGSLGNIGQRNIESVKNIMRVNGIFIKAEDTGGNYARTMLLVVSTGNVVIRTFGRAELVL